MAVTSDPQTLFSARCDRYAQFIRWMRYPHGLRAFFNAWPLLRSDRRVVDAGVALGDGGFFGASARTEDHRRHLQPTADRSRQSTLI